MRTRCHAARGMGRLPVSRPYASSMEARKLSAGLIARLAGRGTVRRYRRGELVLREGARGSGIYVVSSGKLTVFTADSDGRELIYNTLQAGEILGELFLDGGRRSASVRAATEAECIHVAEREIFAFMAEEPAFAEFLVLTLIRRLRHATALVRRLGLDDVSARVVDVLRADAEWVDGRLVVPLALTQQEIAQRVGATREMVNRVMKKLVELGYLSR